MKGEMMNVETLSRPELLTLLSVLEGELEAQDVVIHALRAQHRDSFVQERYGQYDLSDPFLALQRDSETMDGWTDGEQAPGGGGETAGRAGRGSAVGPNPLAVLKLVMAHCKRMQERMMGQLAAAESRHRRVIADLEEERRGHARDAAQGDDVTFMLEKEREKLLQQLELERAAVRRLEKEQRRAAGQAEDSLSHQRQLSSALTQELQRASSQALEEAERVAQLRQRLQEESGAAEALRGALEGERGRAAQLEARAERQLAELDTEREQMRARIRREEERSRELEREVDELRRRLGEGGGERGKEEEVKEVKGSPPSKTVVAPASLTSGQMEPDGKGIVTPKTPTVSKVNGHHPPREAEPPQESSGAENGVDNVGGAGPHSPLHTHPQSHAQSHPHPNLSPSSTASSSLSSSPVSSPVLAKRLGSPGFHQSSYQAGVNQRFHAARHKFQSQAELETQPLSPRDLSPTTTPVPPPPENTAAKQLARNTVTQVLSRFTSQQAGTKLPPLNSSPFGTDYRSLAASPPASSGKSSPGPLSPGIRSPLTPRSHPPPIPPKKPGMSPSPSSPGPPARASLFPELTGGCGLSNGQEGAKEQDIVLSSSS